MLDLYNYKYDRQTLKDNIYSVKLIDIVKTQTIDVDFVVRYILNEKYQLHEDDCVTTEDILKYQPQIKYKDLQDAFFNLDSDEDSIDDFETVSK
jgi:hypothetical protein